MSGMKVYYVALNKALNKKSVKTKFIIYKPYFLIFLDFSNILNFKNINNYKV